MDSRVAGYITEVLYEIQRGASAEDNEVPIDEEKPLPKIFDDDEIEPQSYDSFDPNMDESTSEAINGTVEESEGSNGKCTPTRKRRGSENYNHEPPEIHARPPSKKSASAEVKERIRNNILKHDEQSKRHGENRPNGVTLHKMNGTDSNTLHVNDLRRTTGEHNSSSTSSTTSTAPSPGSMTVVA